MQETENAIIQILSNTFDKKKFSTCSGKTHEDIKKIAQRCI